VESLGEDVVITKNAENEDFFVSGESESFVLTEAGLGEAPQSITGACNAYGSFYGVFSEDESTEAIVVTDVIDFGYRDLKTVTTVEVGANTSDDVFVAVDYRYEESASWQRSSWVPVSPEGFARVQITAPDVRIAVKTSDYSGFELDYINVRWQRAGRRTVRGLNVTQTNA